MMAHQLRWHEKTLSPKKVVAKVAKIPSPNPFLFATRFCVGL
jgi:hypothetical protein